MAHSTLGPSSAHRWMNCPGSVALAAKAPPRPTSIHAAEGTVAHTLAEQLVNGTVSALELLDRVGSVVKADGYDIEITEEMVNGAIEYYDVIYGDRRQIFDASPRPAQVVTKFELRVSAPSIDKRVWGTTDATQYRKGHWLVVYDYKYGKGVAVEVEDNEQGLTYVLGVMETEAGEAYEGIEFVIVQPRAPHSEGSVRRWRISKEQLKEFRDRASKAAVETQNPNAKLAAGSWCRWCPAVALCPEMHRAAAKSAAVAFSDPAPMEPTKMEARLPDVRLMNDAQLVQAFAWEETVNGFFEAVKEVLRERLSAGEQIPGVKLVEGRSNRKWVSEEQMIAELTPIVGSQEKLYERSVLSPAKVEKLVGKRHPIDHLTFKPEGKKAIALDKDPRPAARSSAQEAFTELPAPPTSLWP